jgi:hypothetical protein
VLARCAQTCMWYRTAEVFFVQVQNSIVFGAPQEAVALLPADHKRGHPWTIRINGSLAVGQGQVTAHGAAAPPAALLVGSERMPSGSLTQVLTGSVMATYQAANRLSSLS